jgi:hypothetical protein
MPSQPMVNISSQFSTSYVSFFLTFQPHSGQTWAFSTAGSGRLDTVLTAAHTPLFWRYDLNPLTNPYLMERLGINAVFNPGAIELDSNIYLVCRVEGYDRKSFFAVPKAKMA